LLDGSAPGDIFGADFTGAAFPYLSTNLDFSTDPNLAPLEAAGGQAPQPNAVTSSVVLEENGELIGVVGATTPTLASISSPGSVGISPSPFAANPTPEQLDALAAEIQLEVDALLAANPEMNKIVLLSHMQQLDIERALATRLENVDVIIGGGSNTRLFDDNDRVRDGDSDQGQYPEFYTNAGGAQTALVNTDGSYKYVGRLVLNFDAEGDIIPGSYDPAVSGAYATDAQGLADVAGAEGLIDPEIRAIVEAIEQQVLSTEGNVFGVSDVFLNGNRSGGPLDGVRTQETNLGNLTADANLDAARDLGESEVVISIKNGGGIRASIGETVVPPGGAEAVRQPNSALTDGDGVVIKPEGGISQNDIETTLAFNNGLVALTLTGAEIVALLEHGVGAIPGVSGRFPQIAGLEFAYDPDLPEGARIQSAAVKDGDGALIAELVREGVALNGDQTFRVVTLDFLSAPRFDDDGNFIGAGDGYPFPNTNDDPAVGEVGDPDVIARVNRVELAQDGVTEDGGATFAEVGSEQDALAEYLLENFGAPAAAFADVDTPPELDERIQNLDFREDTVLDPLVVEGGPGRDNLIGGDFSETFIGFGGNADSFTGGGGADRFVYGDELTNGARERFFIRDYSSAEGDVIELATDSFDVRFSGRQAVISAGEDRIYVRGDFAGVDDLTILTPDADLLS
jgi:2',3'-cyclic-nucleotide 2'-phosphodiesterase (5'-nucleotidase family)